MVVLWSRGGQGMYKWYNAGRWNERTNPQQVKGGGYSIWGINRQRRKGTDNMSNIINKNILKDILYSFFNPTEKPKGTLAAVRVDVEKLVDKGFTIESVYDVIYKAEATRQAQLIYLCTKTLIKVAYMRKPKTREEIAAKRLMDVITMKHNKSLTVSFTQEELFPEPPKPKKKKNTKKKSS